MAVGMYIFKLNVLCTSLDFEKKQTHSHNLHHSTWYNFYYQLLFNNLFLCLILSQNFIISMYVYKVYKQGLVPSVASGIHTRSWMYPLWKRQDYYTDDFLSFKRRKVKVAVPFSHHSALEAALILRIFSLSVLFSILFCNPDELLGTLSTGSF